MKTKRFYSYFLAIAILALSPAIVFAGDYAQLNFIGFSADGKYLAFEEYGSQDGSGFPYSNMFFVDVLKNSYAAPPIRKTIDEKSIKEDKIPGEDVIRAKAKNAATANLKKFKIIAGNTGNLVVARLLSDIDAPKLKPGGEIKDQTISFAEEMFGDFYQSVFELSLKTSEVKLKECEYNYEPTLKFELTLENSSNDGGTVLQKDSTLPASRGCPHTYSIQNVFLFGDKIAVFMNVYTMGFEGPDMRFLVATGKYR